MAPELAQQIARWRFIVIAPLLDEALSGKERGHLRRQIAARPHQHPPGASAAGPRA